MGFFPKGQEITPWRGLSVTCFPTPSWLQQLSLFPGPESQGCLQGVWLEHGATPSPFPSWARALGLLHSPQIPHLTVRSITSVCMARRKVSMYCWKQALVHEDTENLRIHTNSLYRLYFQTIRFGRFSSEGLRHSLACLSTVPVSHVVSLKVMTVAPWNLNSCFEQHYWQKSCLECR